MSSPFRSVHLPYNWWTNRDGAPIVGIVGHNTVGWDSRGYLSRGGDLPDGSDRKVSIHRLIRKDGTQYIYVPEERGANHAGLGKMPAPWKRLNPNRCTLSFELENASDGKDQVDPYTDDQLLSMGYLLAEWRTRYGPLPLLRHGDLDPTRRSDPVGLSVAMMESWFAQARNAPAPDPWAAWGSAYPLPEEQRGWAIPQLWRENAGWLGPAASYEVYVDSNTSIRTFRAGFIVYEKLANAVKVYRRAKDLS